jgi:N-terminal domain of anti-restriction factor ArdC
MLLAAQAHARGIALTHVAGFRTWLKLGRAVRKGEAALRILAPVTVKERDQLTGEQTDQRRVFFKPRSYSTSHRPTFSRARSRWRWSRHTSR